MASSAPLSPSSASPGSSGTAPRPNAAFRALRGTLSPGEFAASVRRAAREIGEGVSCDARYIGRVESGEIRCPNYAYERVFLHMFPGRTLSDLGFAPRSAVRGRRAAVVGAHPAHPADDPRYENQSDEESDVRRRAFMTSGASVAAASIGVLSLAAPAGAAASLPAQRSGAPAPRELPDPFAGVAPRPGHHPGESEARAVEEAVRQIRVLDDRHGAEGLYQRAAGPLRTAYELLDTGAVRQSTTDRLQAGAGELSISVGWLAHDSGHFDDARSHYAEALAGARMAGDPALEAHAFCNTAFLARDVDRPREAIRAAQAAQRAARHLSSTRLLSLLSLREAGGWAGLGDRGACERALGEAHTLFGRGGSDADPEWMTFYGEAELEGLEAQCWSALGDWSRAARHARRAAAVAASRTPDFTRNIALYTAELADDLTRAGRPEEAAEAGSRVLTLLGEVRSPRIRAMLNRTSHSLTRHRKLQGVAAFLDRCPPQRRPT
ncbi:tetratricopeptide repeat protein [Streptomyces sp. NPDC049954]|uniref:tetratricopeptide repeat protein n=1 Tax=Streptomyces sp. NPDC049954 TaxID=3155779 RepID=UPI0034308FD0